MAPMTLVLPVRDVALIDAELDNAIAVGVKGGDPARASEVEQARTLRAKIARAVPWVAGQWPPMTDPMEVIFDGEEWALVRLLLARSSAVARTYGLDRTGEDVEETLRVQLGEP